MKMATLYTYPGYWRSYPVLIAAQYSGVQLNVISGPPEFEPQTGCRTDHFLSKFPLGKVPAFEGENGFLIHESNAIAHYVGTDALRGSGPKDYALVQQWVSYADGELVPSVANWVYPTLGVTAYNKQASEKAQTALRGALSFLNEHLQTRTFLVGERVSLADITVVCALLLLYKQVLDPSLREPFSNVTRWFCTCVHQPQFSAVLGEVKLCEKAAQCQGKKDVKTPKKTEQKTEEEADATDEAMAAEPKAKDPFAALPPSPFVLDEFKRQYSNEDPQTVALPHFWEHFDRDGWSLWYAEYKYPNELGEVFMSSNLIAGVYSATRQPGTCLMAIGVFIRQRVEACSSVSSDCARTALPVWLSSGKTATAPSLGSGSSEGSSWHSSSAMTGRWIMARIPGGSWTLTARSARPW